MTKSPEIYAALRKRYCAPEWALFFEVANGTGSNIRRYADAVAMNLFPSRGLSLNGFEIKAYRNDWQREVKNPQKAEEGIYRFCDYWWVVATAGIVKKDELPETWGLIELQGGTLRQVKAAPRLTAIEPTKSFLAAMLRRASEVDENVIKRLVDARVGEAQDRINERIESEVERRTKENERKLKHVAEIEQQLGVSLTDYTAHPGIGRILRAIDRVGMTHAWRGIREMQATLSKMAGDLKLHIDEFDKAAPEIKSDKTEKAA